VAPEYQAIQYVDNDLELQGDQASGLFQSIPEHRVKFNWGLLRRKSSALPGGQPPINHMHEP
jgi:hypothetical protein